MNPQAGIYAGYKAQQNKQALPGNTGFASYQDYMSIGPPDLIPGGGPSTSSSFPNVPAAVGLEDTITQPSFITSGKGFGNVQSTILGGVTSVGASEKLMNNPSSALSDPFLGDIGKSLDTVLDYKLKIAALKQKAGGVFGGGGGGQSGGSSSPAASSAAPSPAAAPSSAAGSGFPIFPVILVGVALIALVALRK